MAPVLGISRRQPSDPNCPRGAKPELRRSSSAELIKAHREEQPVFPPTQLVWQPPFAPCVDPRGPSTQNIFPNPNSATESYPTTKPFASTKPPIAMDDFSFMFPSPPASGATQANSSEAIEANSELSPHAQSLLGVSLPQGD